MKTRDVQTLLLAEVARVTGEPLEHVNVDQSLSEVGMDSVGYGAMAAFIEKRFGVTLGPERLFEFPSIALTAARIAELLEAKHANPLVDESVVSPAEAAADAAESDAGDIAIVGMAVKLPGANDLSAYWALIESGRSQISAFPEERLPPGQARAGYLCGGFVSDAAAFDASFFGISPREAVAMDPQQRWTLECAWHALEDAGYSAARINGTNTSVFVGASSFDYFELLLRSPVARTTHIGTGVSHAVLPNRLSQFFNLKGASEAIDTACSSGLVALWRGVEALRRGDTDLAIVAAVNLLGSPTPFQIFADAGMLSQTGECVPFASGAGGYVRGEGAACVLIKRLRDAQRDGDHIHAVVKGGAVRHSGRTNSLTAPNPDAQADVIVAALRDAAVDPLSIGYVEAHGTGTALGDPIEANGLQRAFARMHREFQREAVEPHFVLGSVKSQIGHLEACAGLAGLIKTVLVLSRGTLPASPYLEAVNPQIAMNGAPFAFSKTPQPWTPKTGFETRRAAVSSFGFGGVNAHMILEEAPHVKVEPIRRVSRVFCFSTKSASTLRTLAETWLSHLEALSFTAGGTETIYLRDLSFTLNQRRSELPHRLAVVASSRAELTNALRRWLNDAPSGFSGRADATVLERRLADAELGDAEAAVRNWLAECDLTSLSQWWVLGLDVPWTTLGHGLTSTEGTAARPVRGPGYPFVREAFWVKPPASEAALPAVRAVAATNSNPAYALFTLGWQKRSLIATTPPLGDGLVLLVSGPRGREVAALSQLPNCLVVDVTAPRTSTEPVHGLVDLTALDETTAPSAANSARKLERVREWIGPDLKRGRALDVIQITCGTQAVTGSAPYNLHGAAELGLYRNLWAEYRACRSKTIDVTTFDAALIASIVAAELTVHDGASEVAYHRGGRWVRDVQRVAVSNGECDSTGSDSNGEVALITGGTGGIGLQLAHELATRGARALLLSGRAELSLERQQTLAAIRDLGTIVEIYRGELTDAAALNACLSHFTEAHGALDFVYHLAGTVDRTTPAFFQKDARSLARVLTPKVDALTVLHGILEQTPPKRCFLFSSISSVAPTLSAGILDYASANRYLDTFTHYQHALGHRFYASVQWAAWRNTGLVQERRDAHTGRELEPATCFAALWRLRAAEELPPVVCVAAADEPALTPNALERPLRERAETRSPSQSAAPAALASPAADSAEFAQVLASVRSIVARQLEFDESKLDERASFDALGVDSIVLTDVVMHVERGLNVTVDPAELIARNSIYDVARYVCELRATSGAAPLTARGSEASASASTPASTAMPPSTAVSVPVEPTHAPAGATFKVAVIGMACRFPGAPTKERFWSNLVNGVDSVSEVPTSRWDAAALYTARHEAGRSISQWGGFVDGIEWVNPALFGMGPNEAADVDPLIRLFTEASLAAVSDSKYGDKGLGGQRVGVFVGSRASRYAERITQPGKQSVTGIGQNFIAAFTSHLLDLRGPSLVIDSACSSSLAAVHLACQSLMSGDSELAIAGGVDLLLDEKPYLYLSAAHALSPDGRCHTFDARANGFVPGEGAGAVLLKPLDRALADGDPIYAVIDGSAINNDGNTLGVTTPGVDGQADVIERAVKRAAVPSSSISYVETHGTGTLIGDPIELRALNRAFASDPPRECAIGSVKTNLGHLLSAAGIASFIKVALAVHHGTLPPTLHCERANPRFDFDKTPFTPLTDARTWEPAAGVRRAGISAFGFGKTNVHLIVSERPKAAAAPQTTERSHVVEPEKVYAWHPPVESPSGVASLLQLEEVVTLTHEGEAWAQES